MKKLGLFLMILLPIQIFGQINESFSDGDYTKNPTWTGTSTNFIVNANGQLQSSAKSASSSWLFTASEAISEALWECSVHISYSTSSSNYCSFYIVSDADSLNNGCNGYYVQIGGTNDEVSLYLQQGSKKTKLIDGTDKRTDGSVVDMKIKVTRDKHGNFNLYSKKAEEADYISEGSVQNTQIEKSNYCGLYYQNTATTGNDYYFDDITVTGAAMKDTLAPVLVQAFIRNDSLMLEYNEAVDISSGQIKISEFEGIEKNRVSGSGNQQTIVVYDKAFPRGKLMQLCLSGVRDMSGNIMKDSCIQTGMKEKSEQGDLIINEIMFNQPEHSDEYVEIYNKSEKLLDVSGVNICTIKADGSYNTISHFPANTFIASDGYLALTANKDSVIKYHRCPLQAQVVSSSWSSLNNESAQLVLLNPTKDSIYDEVNYSYKWHHNLIIDPKGVSLERINPALSSTDPHSWHSASTANNYGTPGYINSQYIKLTESEEDGVEVVPQAFTPDNDGIDDVSIIRYKTATSGQVANVWIMTSTGEKVYKLASEILLSTSGELIWDGLISGGKNVNAGIYVVYFEVFNTTTGIRKVYKKPVVVTFR